MRGDLISLSTVPCHTRPLCWVCRGCARRQLRVEISSQHSALPHVAPCAGKWNFLSAFHGLWPRTGGEWRVGEKLQIQLPSPCSYTGDMLK